MARGKTISDEVEGLITGLHKKHPKWKAPMIREEASAKLRDKDPRLPKTWPSLSSVQKVLAKANKVELTPSPLDQPWSAATAARLDAYPMCPQAAAAVFEVWALWAKHDAMFTIREARWVARLAGIERFAGKVGELGNMARFYARAERIYELMGRPFNSGELDRMVMGLEVTVTGASVAWMLAATEEDTEKGVKDGVQQVADAARDRKIPASSMKAQIHFKGKGGKGNEGS